MNIREIEKDRGFLLFVGVCLGIILAGIVVVLLNKPFVGFGIILNGLLMIVFRFYLLSTKPKEYFLQDERSVRIREKAGYNAYIATLIVIFLLMAFGSTIPLIGNANYRDVSAFIFFAGLSCFSIFNWYYSKKGG
ncbi:DUF2178 domain-containing protein [Candidatus Methanoperedens nitratireducens]|uniref:DUF2178 domain-containing protein n=1 Tax=Candidatus Methanoperedens nitratireducens TaxID=1392998 RepID=A0A284VPZ0_9EURY|nr:DUF2178 domain-containing protein [Candidatus Methanoperedens nitroreducens]SNQ61322.1 conserved membrane hypothetical protein [Candidatus Methanoperedens nitroreducens]